MAEENMVAVTDELSTVPVSGRCDARFAAVRDALIEQVASGNELGASVVVDLDGQPVVDLWGGWKDAARTQPWEQDTIVNVWSSSKTVTNLAALILADRGLLDLDAPVARYWPEFAATGKQDVLVRHVLAHTSGVSGWEPPFEVEELYDWDSSVRRLAEQAPWWQPGTASGYHAQTQGFLVGEIVRRVTGQSLPRFVSEQIATPLEADFRFGVAGQDVARVAPVMPPPPLDIDFSAIDPEGPMFKTLTTPITDAAVANSSGWRGACLGATNGHGNARSMARMLRVLALGGEADGHRLLSADAIDRIFEEQSHGADLVLGIPLRFGIGWALPETESVPYVGQGRTCYWGGWGGSLIVTDLDRRLTISYMMNKMGPGIIGSDRSEAYVRAVYDALDG